MATTHMHTSKVISDLESGGVTMKEIYEVLMMEKILFPNDDIVTTSPNSEYPGEEFPNEG